MTNMFCKSKYQIIEYSDTGEGSELSTEGRGCRGDHRNLRLVCEKIQGRKEEKEEISDSSKAPRRLCPG